MPIIFRRPAGSQRLLGTHLLACLSSKARAPSFPRKGDRYIYIYLALTSVRLDSFSTIFSLAHDLGQVLACESPSPASAFPAAAAAAAAAGAEDTCSTAQARRQTSASNSSTTCLRPSITATSTTTIRGAPETSHFSRNLK